MRDDLAQRQIHRDIRETKQASCFDCLSLSLDQCNHTLKPRT